MNYQELLNTNIKELRLKQNLTQEEFAEKIGLSIQGLSNIERNRYQPNAETIDKICKIFNISPLELLIKNDEKKEDILHNINGLLSSCTATKLKKIYEIISLLIKI